MQPVTSWDQVAAIGILIGCLAGVALVVCLIVYGLTRSKTGGES